MIFKKKNDVSKMSQLSGKRNSKQLFCGESKEKIIKKIKEERSAANGHMIQTFTMPIKKNLKKINF